MCGLHLLYTLQASIYTEVRFILCAPNIVGAGFVCHRKKKGEREKVYRGTLTCECYEPTLKIPWQILQKRLIN